MDIRSYYDDFSESYDQGRRSAYHKLIDELELDVAVPYARGARVLELGCGTGLILERVAELAKEAVGVDFSEGMARQARARGLDVRMADVCDLPFEDDRFDLTYAFKVLAHVPDITGAIREAVRVTRPGGHLLLELYNPWSLRYLAKRIAGPQPIGDRRTEADVYTRWDSPWSIRKELPPNVDVLDFRGIRIVTPFAAVHKVSQVARSLNRLERMAGRTPLRYFGGFVIAILRKQR